MTMTCSDPAVELIVGEEDHLRRVARRLVRCEADSDDLVQETLLRAYHARDRLQPNTSVRAWTTTILRRLFLTAVIRAKRRGIQTDTDAGGPIDAASGRSASPYDSLYDATHDSPYDPAHDSADGDPAASVHALADSIDDVLKRALDRVPEIHRTSFLLAAVRDLSCEEIGRRLSVPSGTVMSRVHRARERLRSDLAHHPRARLTASAAHRR